MQKVVMTLAPGEKERINKKLEIEELPESEQHEIKYIAEGCFQNGCTVLVKLCSGSSNYFLDVVLFGVNGHEMCCRALESLPDVIEIEHDEEKYIMTVKEVGE